MKSVRLTGNDRAPALHDPAATDQALFIPGSQLVLTEVDQRRHLLVKQQGLVFFLSQAEESFDKGLQTHSCKEKAFKGDSGHSALQQSAFFTRNSISWLFQQRGQMCVRRVRTHTIVLVNIF